MKIGRPIPDPAKKGMSPSVWTGCAAPLIAYLGAALLLGRLPVSDEAYFKAAGYQWSRTGQFAAAEMTGFHLLEGSSVPVEKLFAAYPPTYPFLFGLAVRLAGFGWQQCVLYDATIHVLMVLAVLLWAGRVDRRFAGPLAVAVAAILLLRTTAGRPDELAMTFGMLGLYWLMDDEHRFRNALFGGIACGLAAGTSMGAAVSFAPCALAAIFTREASWKTNLGVAAVVGSMAAVTFGLVILPLLLCDIRAIDQFLTLARTIRRYENEYLARGVSHAWRTGKGLILLNVACYAVAIVGAAFRGGLLHKREWIALWFGPTASALYLLWMFPSKYTYLWFTTPILIVASLLVIVRLAQKRPRAAAMLSAVLAVALAGAAIGTLKNILVMASLDKSQTATYNEARLRALIPDGSTALAADAWPLLRARCKVYAAYEFSRPELDTIDFVVLNSNGSGTPGVAPIPEEFRDYIQRHFELIDDNLPRRPLMLYGVRLTNSAYGFGCYVLARKANSPCTR